MKVLIESNPNQKPLLGYKRVVEKGISGERDTEVDEHTLTRAPGTKYTFMVAPSVRLGGYLNTGLLFEVENEYKALTSYKSEEWKKILEGTERITKQTELEYKHGRPVGFYTNVINSGYTKIEDKDIPYFQRAESTLSLNDGVTVLDLTKPREEVLFYNLKAADIIANSFSEISSTTKYFISIADETAVAKQSKKRKENMALGRLEEIFELKDGTVINFCKIVGGTPSSRINLTEPQAYNELDSFIKKNEIQANQFNIVYKMYDKEIIKFNVKVKLWDLLSNRIIYKKGNEFIWDAPRDEDGVQMEKVTWDRESDVLEYLEDPRYQKEQELLDRQLVAKTRA
jgi:hypothetical protein